MGICCKDIVGQDNENPRTTQLDDQSVTEPSSPESCPVISPLPPTSSCEGRVSDCWSVGVHDLDCQDNALCCFDGCVNVCMHQQHGKTNQATIESRNDDFVFPDQPKEYQLQFSNSFENDQTQNPFKQEQANSNLYPSATHTKQSQLTQGQASIGEGEVKEALQTQTQPPSSTQTPFIQCPSAMKCVPKTNCDFNGVMVNYTVLLSQDIEARRVPLIVNI